MTIRHAVSIGFFLICFFYGFSQNRTNEIVFLFYNAENFFDSFNDTLTNDEEFLPHGIRGWNQERFIEKVNKISKVILNSAGWEPPELIGLCEVENYYVLQKLIQSTALKTFGYKIIHKESPDERGIDVAFLYNAAKFYPLNYNFYPLKNGNDSIFKSREILYVCGLVNQTDSLHLIINHWPSRFSGIMNTEKYRILAAELVSEISRKILSENANSKIIIAGDFNDEPNNKSIEYVLQAKPISNQPKNSELYNLSYSWMKDEVQTLKYQSQWAVFDQIIVSGNLLNSFRGIRCHANGAKIVKLPFLLKADEKFGGVKPFRTFNGAEYQNGFSDHLPVMLPLKTD